MTLGVKLFSVIAAVLVLAGTAPAAYVAVPDAYAQTNPANVAGCPDTAEAIKAIPDDGARMLCNIQFAKAQTERGYQAVTGLLKYVLLAAVVLVIVVLLIRRSTGDETDENKLLDKSKGLLFVLIIATAILWVGDALLGLDSGTTTTDGVNDGDGDTVTPQKTCPSDNNQAWQLNPNNNDECLLWNVNQAICEADGGSWGDGSPACTKSSTEG